MMSTLVRTLAAALVIVAAAAPARPAQGGRSAAAVSVLATNAIIGPLTGLADDYKRQTGTEVKLAFETSPTIARRLAAGELAGTDVLILATAAAEQAVKDGSVGSSEPTGQRWPDGPLLRPVLEADGRVHVGRSGVGSGWVF